MILAGDVGATKTVLAWVDRGVVRRSQRYRSADHTGLADIVRRFVASSPVPAVKAACFGIPGPVVDGVAKTTNLPWVVDRRDFVGLLGTSDVSLINDLEAIAHGVGTFADADTVTLAAGRSDHAGNAAVIAAGTGLGEAGLFWDGRRHRPFASEGGHAGFAPRNDLEIGLLRFLLAEHAHVSWERVLSGPGLHNIYRYLRSLRPGDEPAWLAERLHGEDPAPVIAECALEHTSPLCEQALALFVSLYGAEAANLALKVLATGGVFVAGGIAPKILPAIKAGFMDAFLGQGRLRSVLEAIPVRVVLSDEVALRGAARAAEAGLEGDA